MKRGFTPNEANKFLYENTLRYHPLLDELFQELINESPRKGIPVIFQRNPTLTRLSAQRLYIRRIKKDPRINTISPSVNILSGMNADFDGDALNGIVILDQKTLEKLDPLAPRNGVLDLRAPRAISGHVSLSSTIIATIANFIHHGR
ncbi:RNA polymerase Rpb1, domain 2 [compost metagenome]